MRTVTIAMLLTTVAVTAASLADLALVRTLDLRGDTHHVQGIDFDDRRLWLTGVDKEARKGYLQEFSLTTGELTRTVDVTSRDRFHPGGLSADGESLWLPVAE